MERVSIKSVLFRRLLSPSSSSLLPLKTATAAQIRGLAGEHLPAEATSEMLKLTSIGKYCDSNLFAEATVEEGSKIVLEETPETWLNCSEELKRLSVTEFSELQLIHGRCMVNDVVLRSVNRLLNRTTFIAGIVQVHEHGGLGKSLPPGDDDISSLIPSTSSRRRIKQVTPLELPFNAAVPRLGVRSFCKPSESGQRNKDRVHRKRKDLDDPKIPPIFLDTPITANTPFVAVTHV
ncbi:hypothetical protein NP233_g891 [Leucocoprinus birnbaumii]|uniref:Uncharacterized protein n=1 Tax=Leucocoprinus birnbaumii TaxID=56174 RepID=A0AAD5W4X2_9AGAR|nr:hypothetical protein NP233_g891 [Leucocoprinus birnbaumii]